MTFIQLTVDASLCVAPKDLITQPIIVIKVNFSNYWLILLIGINMRMKLIRTKFKYNQNKQWKHECKTQ